MKIYKISDDCRAWMDNALVYIKTYSSSANYPKANIMLDMEELKALYELVFPPKEEEKEAEEVKERCKECKFFDDYNCVRYPEKKELLSSGYWCGEFKRK